MAKPLPTELLMQLLSATFEPWGASGVYPSRPPTAESVQKIQDALGIALPKLFIEMAAGCSSYGGWFGSIGEDFESLNHMISINRAFHSDGFDRRYVLLNHGHDGDIDALDTRSVGSSGEHPIVYISEGPDGTVTQITRTHDTFHEYLSDLCRNSARSCPIKSLRRAAKRLLAKHENQARVARRQTYRCRRRSTHRHCCRVNGHRAILAFGS
jgi:hypothetical protein